MKTDLIQQLKNMREQSDKGIYAQYGKNGKYSFSIYDGDAETSRLDIELIDKEQPNQENKNYKLTLATIDGNELNTAIINKPSLLKLTGLLFQDTLNNDLIYAGGSIEGLTDVLMDFCYTLKITSGYNEFEPD